MTYLALMGRDTTNTCLVDFVITTKMIHSPRTMYVFEAEELDSQQKQYGVTGLILYHLMIYITQLILLWLWTQEKRKMTSRSLALLRLKETRSGSWQCPVVRHFINMGHQQPLPSALLQSINPLIWWSPKQKNSLGNSQYQTALLSCSFPPWLDLENFPWLFDAIS